MLKEKKIHCSDPTKLNDPWDCKPWFHKPADGISPAMNWERMSAGIQAEIAKRRIYCLTPDPLSILMWSHYGSNHTGICLEFHLSNLLFNKVMGVIYEDDFPSIAPDEMYDRVYDVLLTKAKCWHYEQEYRLIASPFLEDTNPLKVHTGDFLALPDLALMSVIVGCNGDYDAVRRIVDANAPSLRVTRIVRAPNEYKLLMGLHSEDDRKNTRMSWPPPTRVILPSQESAASS